MSVYDRWHKTYPKRGDEPCTCGSADRPLYPTGDHKKGDRWQVRWKNPDGKGCKRNFRVREGRDRERHADAYDKWIQGELTKGTYKDPAKGDVPLEAYAAAWRARLPNGKPRTDQNRDFRLAYIYDMPRPAGAPRSRRKGDGHPSLVGKKSMRYLENNPDLLQQWIKSLEDFGLKPDCIRQTAYLLSSIFKAAIHDGSISVNPLDGPSIKLPPPEPPVIRPWTAENVAGVAEWIEENHPRQRAIIDITVGSGLRQGEAFALGEDAFLFDENVIKVNVAVVRIDNVLCFSLPKRDKVRNAPMDEEVAEIAKRQMKDYPPVPVTLPWGTPSGPPHTVNLLFVTGELGAWSASDFNYRVFFPARQHAGIKGGRGNGFHVLRHTFASICLANGGDIRALAADLGHDDPAFTLKRYGHLIVGHAERSRAATSAFLGRVGKILKASALEVP